ARARGVIPQCQVETEVEGGRLGRRHGPPLLAVVSQQRRNVLTPDGHEDRGLGGRLIRLVREGHPTERRFREKDCRPRGRRQGRPGRRAGGGRDDVRRVTHRGNVGGCRSPPYPGRQGLGHHVAVLMAVLQAELVAQLVGDHRQQVHPTEGRATGGRGELRVVGGG